MKQDLLSLNLDLKKLKPVAVAKLHYLLFSEVPFEADLMEYLLNGIVIARPGLFGMARLCDVRPLDDEGKPIGEEPEFAWFVRWASGNLLELLFQLPAYLPKIAFCRNKPGKPLNKKLHVWPLERLVRLAVLHAQKGNKLCLNLNAA